MGWTCWVQGVVENKDETDHETWQQGNPWNLWKNSFFYRNLLIFVLCSSKTQSGEFSRTLVSRRNPGLKCKENQSLSWAHWLSESSHIAVVVPRLGSSQMTGPASSTHRFCKLPWFWCMDFCVIFYPCGFIEVPLPKGHLLPWLPWPPE